MRAKNCEVMLGSADRGGREAVFELPVADMAAIGHLSFCEERTPGKASYVGSSHDGTSAAWHPFSGKEVAEGCNGLWPLGAVRFLCPLNPHLSFD